MSHLDWECVMEDRRNRLVDYWWPQPPRLGRRTCVVCRGFPIGELPKWRQRIQVIRIGSNIANSWRILPCRTFPVRIDLFHIQCICTAVVYCVVVVYSGFGYSIVERARQRDEKVVERIKMRYGFSDRCLKRKDQTIRQDKPIFLSPDKYDINSRIRTLEIIKRTFVTWPRPNPWRNQRP